MPQGGMSKPREAAQSSRRDGNHVSFFVVS
jgi:hypothetical protein